MSAFLAWSLPRMRHSQQRDLQVSCFESKCKFLSPEHNCSGVVALHSQLVIRHDGLHTKGRRINGALCAISAQSLVALDAVGTVGTVPPAASVQHRRSRGGRSHSGQLGNVEQEGAGVEFAGGAKRMIRQPGEVLVL